MVNRLPIIYLFFLFFLQSIRRQISYRGKKKRKRDKKKKRTCGYTIALQNIITLRKQHLMKQNIESKKSAVDWCSFLISIHHNYTVLISDSPILPGLLLHILYIQSMNYNAGGRRWLKLVETYQLMKKIITKETIFLLFIFYVVYKKRKYFSSITIS